MRGPRSKIQTNKADAAVLRSIIPNLMTWASQAHPFDPARKTSPQASKVRKTKALLGQQLLGHEPLLRVTSDLMPSGPMLVSSLPLLVWLLLVRRGYWGS